MKRTALLSLLAFVSPLFAVAVRLEADDAISVSAPFGLEDLFALRLQPNPSRPTNGFMRTAGIQKNRVNSISRWLQANE